MSASYLKKYGAAFIKWEVAMKKHLRVVMEFTEENNMGMNNGRKNGERAFLDRFDQYEKICIQCHDNPDADALASGYALWSFFKEKGKEVTFVYGGANQIQKSNLLLMIKELEIPVQYVTELPDCDLLIMADCQYGSGNVTKWKAPEIAMVDHHQCGLMQGDHYCIKSNLGSCSTVVWSLFQEVGFDISRNIHLSTALYYGLYMDTSQFEEIFHPLDKDMRDTLEKDDQLLFHLMNTNLSLEELSIAGEALTKRIYDEEYRFSVIPVKQCDPNILGIVSDFVIQVEEINTCVAFNPNPGGYKLSVRSCVKEAKANEMAQFLCADIGNGGGHLTKGGGFIAKKSFEQTYPDCQMQDYLCDRIRNYFDSYEVIYAKTYQLDKAQLQPYLKKAIPVGVTRAEDFLKMGTPILVRTLEGDVDLIVSKDLYFMIGIEGEVYPIRKEKFERTYRYVDEVAEFDMEYAPTIRNNIDGEIYRLMDYMRSCVASGTTKIYAKPLEKNVKVFTAWDEHKYYTGQAGDYIVMREDDEHDIYIVRGDIFKKTYEKVEE